MKSCKYYENLIKRSFIKDESIMDNLELMAHLESCDSCKTLYNNNLFIKNSLHKLASQPLKEVDLKDKIMYQIENQDKKVEKKRFSYKYVPVLTSLVLIITIFAIGNKTNLFNLNRKTLDNEAQSVNEQAYNLYGKEKSWPEALQPTMETASGESGVRSSLFAFDYDENLIELTVEKLKSLEKNNIIFDLSENKEDQTISFYILTENKDFVIEFLDLQNQPEYYGSVTSDNQNLIQFTLSYKQE